jgi:hypothetical protein
MLIASFALPANDHIDTTQSFLSALTTLKDATMSARENAIFQLADSKHERSIIVLRALLDGKLFTLKTDNQLVIGEE